MVVQRRCACTAPVAQIEVRCKLSSAMLPTAQASLATTLPIERLVISVCHYEMIATTLATSPPGRDATTLTRSLGMSAQAPLPSNAELSLCLTVVDYLNLSPTKCETAATQRSVAGCGARDDGITKNKKLCGQREHGSQ